MMAVINLETAVYWGQLSRCKPVFTNLPHYSCQDVAAYGAVAAFAVLILLCQTGFTVGLVRWRGEFIDESGAFDSITGKNEEGMATIRFNSDT